MVIEKLEELYDQLQRVEHDQMAANGVQCAIEVINNMQDDKISDEEREMNEILDFFKNELYRENEKKELIDKRIEKLNAMIRKIEKESAQTPLIPRINPG
jgi:hypothetical protein